MTQQSIAVPQPAQQPPEPAPIAQEPRPDKLQPLATVEIDAEIRRLTKQKDPDASQCHQEIAGTVLPIMKELAQEVLELRNYVAWAHNEHADQLDEHEERLGLVEGAAFGGDSQLTAEDAELFGKVAEIADSFIDVSRSSTTDAAGIAKLDELQALVQRAKARLDEIELVDDDDDDDEAPAEDNGAAPPPGQS